MARYPSPTHRIAFGPDGLSYAVKMLLIANTAMFVAGIFAPAIPAVLGLHPQQVVTEFAVWQLVTYMFLHADVFHILFNMLSLWMFGVELEKTWGTRFFTKYYAVTGIGAGLITVGLSLLPGMERSFYANTIGASGAIYGLLLAYGLYFPNRQLMLLIPPIPMRARTFVILYALLELVMGVTGTAAGVAHFAHLGGMLGGYLMIRYRRGFRRM